MALKERPSLLEIAAYAYFPGAFLIGPQFSMRRYLDFVDGQLTERVGYQAMMAEREKPGPTLNYKLRKKIRESISISGTHLVFQDPQTGTVKLPDCVWAGLSRALIGFVYVAVFQIGTLYVSDQYLFEPSFQKKNLIKKLLLVGLWGRINLYKYVSCWLITEGVCGNKRDTHPSKCIVYSEYFCRIFLIPWSTRYLSIARAIVSKKVGRPIELFSRLLKLLFLLT